MRTIGQCQKAITSMGCTMVSSILLENSDHDQVDSIIQEPHISCHHLISKRLEEQLSILQDLSQSGISVSHTTQSLHTIIMIQAITTKTLQLILLIP